MRPQHEKNLNQNLNNLKKIDEKKKRKIAKEALATRSKKLYQKAWSPSGPMLMKKPDEKKSTPKDDSKEEQLQKNWQCKSSQKKQKKERTNMKKNLQMKIKFDDAKTGRKRGTNIRDKFKKKLMMQSCTRTITQRS